MENLIKKLKKYQDLQSSNYDRWQQSIGAVMAIQQEISELKQQLELQEKK